ncbi:group 1 truncated hemoglobin [Pseudidiomarina sp. 1APP75-32.1]|uniref:Group 1 truncated hemoglobin n=1 Tax=Pseudidiomarina terrestris TaxID=2820060 RepID=A0AAW7QUF2_9GAMM|nr:MULTISPECIES: group 1 truncated hemoglobin [unclassified Pseudidiomarina]MDN7123359.1 group 1 truncated hemoglobin [Pseudidiomarina sp. 1APP75-32.1]MDN7128916.1 group 1 truncated hemoglobin [Pseudidiomarina sp. 1APR75-15]
MKHLVALLVLCAVNIAPSLAQAKSDTLYQELGAQQGISDLMTTFVLEIAEDERVIHHFENVDIDRFHRMLSLHLCELTGGPCTYTGADMVEVHRGMAITRAEFNAVVEDLIAAMEAEGVPTATQNKLLARLAELHGEIVAR